MQYSHAYDNVQCDISTADIDTVDATKVLSTRGTLDIVGPLMIESPRAKKRVSTGAFEALDDPYLVQAKS